MSATHIVHTGDLAYAVMHPSGRSLIPVRITAVHGDVATDQNDMRVTATVTADRAPWRRGEVLHELPAYNIVSRKATGVRKGVRVVLRRTIVAPSDVKGK